MRQGSDLVHRFDRSAAAAPERTAVIAGGAAVTFAELSARVDRIADRLRTSGVRRGSVVGVSLPRCTDLPAAFLAAWRLGAAYLPLDPAHPAERLRWMAEDAGARTVVTRGEGGAWGDDGTAVALDGPGPAQQRPLPDAPVLEGDAAYVIYTSGSTGRPKGVLVSRGNVERFVHALEAAGLYSDGPRVVAWNASASFDASVQQWVRVCRGDTVVLLPEELRTEPEALAGFLRDHGVTDLDATPSHWDVLSSQLLAAPPGGAPLRVLLGGEAVPAPMWSALAAAAASGLIEAANVYGPTECTVDATGTWIEGDDPHIGRALPGMRARVLDSRLEVVEPGAPGELYLGGGGVAHGYVNRPAATAERFVPDPFGEPGARMYRTGDRARLRTDGTLEYLGRADRQVKLHGQRIEPGEVEAVLAGVAGVGSAVAVVRTDPGAGTRLVAYYTPAPGTSPPPAAALREHAARSLPPAMVPSACVVLEALPRTVSGKLDHEALPPPPEEPTGGAGHDEFASEFERVIADTWTEVLGRAALTPDADFFGLGGHSLQALRLVARLRERLGVTVPTRAVYRHSRLREYAAEVQSLRGAGAPAGEGRAPATVASA